MMSLRAFSSAAFLLCAMASFSLIANEIDDVQQRAQDNEVLSVQFGELEFYTEEDSQGSVDNLSDGQELLQEQLDDNPISDQSDCNCIDCECTDCEKLG